MSTTISLESGKYGDFLKCISNLRDVCNDVDIIDGIIRQRSNDNTTIIEMDMNSIIPNVSIALIDLKQKLDLLKIFQGQDVDILIDEDNFTFSDIYSSINFKNPSSSFIDNKFVSEEELNNIFVFDEESLILDYDISNMITERIKVITQVFNSTSIYVQFLGENSSICANTASKDQSAIFAENIMLNIPLENSSSNLAILAFVMDHDIDINFKMYKSSGQNISLNKFNTAIGDVDIKMYSRSSIISENEE